MPKSTSSLKKETPRRIKYNPYKNKTFVYESDLSEFVDTPLARLSYGKVYVEQETK